MTDRELLEVYEREMEALVRRANDRNDKKRGLVVRRWNRLNAIRTEVLARQVAVQSYADSYYDLYESECDGR